MRRKFGFICYVLFVVVGLTYVHYESATQWIIKDKNQTVGHQTPRLFKVPANSETVKMKQIQEAKLRQVNAKRIMRDYCLTRKFHEKLGGLQNILVDDKFKIMYCAIAKVGSSAFKTVLAELHNKTFPPGSPHVHSWNKWRRLNSYSEKEREIRLQTYFKLIFVREPLRRLLSAFKDKFLKGDPQYGRRYRSEIIKLYRPNDFQPGGENWITFAEFIKFYSSERYRDPHWLQYEQICHPCLVNYDFIGRLETLEEDTALLLKLTGLDERINIPKINQHTDPHEVLDYYSQVPPEYIIRIGEQYLNDFLMFGYEYLGSVKPLLNGTWPSNTANKTASANELID